LDFLGFFLEKQILETLFKSVDKKRQGAASNQQKRRNKRDENIHRRKIGKETGENR
jgi:hypothetical protein